MSNPAEATRADREKALIAYRVYHSQLNPCKLRPEDEEWLNTGLSHAYWYYSLSAILAAVVAARLEERAKFENLVSHLEEDRDAIDPGDNAWRVGKRFGMTLTIGALRGELE